MQNQIDIRPYISDLLALNDKTNQEDISKIKRVSLVFVNNKNEVRKALRSRIKDWNNILDKYYEQSKNSSELLSHLKEIAKYIIKEQKTNILRRLLNREGYGDDYSFNKALKRTEEMLTRIINGRCFFEFSHLNFDFKGAPADLASLNKELSISSPSQPISISFANVFPSSEPYDVSKELLMSRVDGMSPEKDDAWLRKLIPTLANIDDNDHFNAVLAKLTFHQIIEVFQDFARAEKGEMLLKILKASKDDMVLELLKSLSKDEIVLINRVIDGVKDTALINSVFGYIREIFVAKVNAPSTEMNTVAKTLRELNHKNKITSFHLNTIASFRKPLEDLAEANAVFKKLLEKRSHYLESATFHMPEKIEATCVNRLARVTNDASSRKHQDNLYTILAELAYGDWEENDDLAAAFANLGINEIDDYIKLGVNVSPMPPKKKDDPNAGNLLKDENTKRYCQIFTYFKSLGIETVSDLIDKNIYNYEQLKSFVNKHAYNPISIPSSALKS